MKDEVVVRFCQDCVPKDLAHPQDPVSIPRFLIPPSVFRLTVLGLSSRNTFLEASVPNSDQDSVCCYAVAAMTIQMGLSGTN